MELKLLDSLPVLIRSFTFSAKKFDVLPNYWVPFFFITLRSMFLGLIDYNVEYKH